MHPRILFLSLFFISMGFNTIQLSAQPLPVTLPFVDEAELRGVNFPLINGSPGFGAGMAAVDLDGDGDADLVITGVDDQVEFLENDGSGYFTSRTEEINLPVFSLARGVAAGDPDGDGDLDLLILCWNDRDRFLRNDGDFQFTDVSEEIGLVLSSNSTGAAFGDLNGDDWLDL